MNLLLIALGKPLIAASFLAGFASYKTVAVAREAPVQVRERVLDERNEARRELPKPVQPTALEPEPAEPEE